MSSDFQDNSTKQFRNIRKSFGSINLKLIPLIEMSEEVRDTSVDLAAAVQVNEASSIWEHSNQPLQDIDNDSITWRLPVVSEMERAHKQVTPLTTQAPESESYLELIRNLAKSSGIYAISALASPLVALVLAPFLTHSLSKTDYGALTVLNTVITLTTAITQVGLNAAITRAYNYDYETQRDRLGVLSTSVILLSLISVSLAIATMLTAPNVASFLLGSPSFANPVRITALAVLMQNLSVPGFAWLRAESRAKFFSILAIANLLITLGANIILVGFAHLGITGSLLATGSGYAVVVICMLPQILLRAGLTLHLDIAKNLLSFGIPLVFNYVSFWVLQLSDRYLLSRLGSLAQTASYGVAYTLGGTLNVVVLGPFILAWPIAMFAIAKRKDGPLVFQLVFRWFSLILLLAAFALTFVAVIVLNFFFPLSYHSATPVIPIIAVSIVFFGIYNIFSVGIGVQRKTSLAALVMTLAALVNVGCNMILIPMYGSTGAAISTLIAYIILALIMYIVNQKIYPIPFQIHIFTIALLVGIALYILSGLLTQNQTIFGKSAIYFGSTIIYGGILVLLGTLPKIPKGRRQRT